MRCVNLLPDALNAAAHQRRQHADAEHYRAHLVGDALRYARGILRPRRGCGHHKPAARLSAAVERWQMRVRPLRPVAGSGAVHQHRVDFAQRIVAHAQPLCHALAVVLHEHIGACRELMDYLSAFGRLEVDRHAALVAVARLEVGVASLAQVHIQRGRPPQAAPGIAVQRFDLDDVRAHIAHHRGAHWTELPHRHIQNPYALQRAVAGVFAIRNHKTAPSVSENLPLRRLWQAQSTDDLQCLQRNGL